MPAEQWDLSSGALGNLVELQNHVTDKGRVLIGERHLNLLTKVDCQGSCDNYE